MFSFSGSPALPREPHLPAHPGGPAGAGESPLAGLAAYGIPITQGPGGNLILQAGRSGQGGSMLPPEIPGMPKMPGPPAEMMGGQAGGGLFQPVSPVAPFSAGNVVRQYRGG